MGSNFLMFRHFLGPPCSLLLSPLPAGHFQQVWFLLQHLVGKEMVQCQSAMIQSILHVHTAKWTEWLQVSLSPKSPTSQSPWNFCSVEKTRQGSAQQKYVALTKHLQPESVCLWKELPCSLLMWQTTTVHFISLGALIRLLAYQLDHTPFYRTHCLYQPQLNHCPPITIWILPAET